MKERSESSRWSGSGDARFGDAQRCRAGRLNRVEQVGARALALLGVTAALGVVVTFAAETKPVEKAKTATEIKELIRGRVVNLTPLFEGRFDTKVDKEMAALYGVVTDEGRVYPILREQRGRAFYQDERLREEPIDLYVRRFEGSSFVQVLLVYRLREGKRFALDYWCDVCSISMYWIQPCECCQGSIRLREQSVTRLPDFISHPEHEQESGRGSKESAR